jgi:hypothetical protein
VPVWTVTPRHSSGIGVTFERAGERGAGAGPAPFGLLTWRRSTVTSCRHQDSAFFDLELRASNPSHATSCHKVR